MESWFLSDIHLKSLEERNGKILLRFFDQLLSGERTATHLFFLGDIFDLWVADHSYFINKYSALIERIRALKEKGIEIYYFEGNHDFHLKKFWSEKLRVQVFSDILELEIEGIHLRLEHGDLINREDKAYLRLRKFLRSLPIKILLHHLPGFLVARIGDSLSQVSRQQGKKRQDHHDKIIEMVRKYAEEISAKSQWNYLITGHVHVRDEFSLTNEGRFQKSINLGSWFKEPAVYRITPMSSEFIQLDVDTDPV